MLRVSILHTTADVDDLLNKLETILKQSNWNTRDCFKINLAVREAAVNAVKHGNHEDQTKKVVIVYRIEDDDFEATIFDEGPGFDPTEIPDPTAPENLERSSGRGLFLMKESMTNVTFNQKGNSVTLFKKRSVSPVLAPVAT